MVLVVVQGGALATGHHAVRLGAVFGVLQAVLLGVQPGRFALIQRAGRDALVDASLLDFPMLIETRSGRFAGQCRAGNQSEQQPGH
jgi:NADPH:quinone reductase-like Zn-dependent oxidoreductase